MDIKKIEKFLEENNQPKFRLNQIMKAIYKDGVASFSEITTLPKELGQRLSKFETLSFEVKKILEANDGQSAKASLRLDDGNKIETVLISPKPNFWSVCVSTQVGCPMNCGFCATGKSGFKRNLTAEEITDQVLFWGQYLKVNKQKLKAENNISNVVYMGMGEPFLNWDNVEESLKILTDKNLFGFGSRSISVSTSGIPDGIINFAKTFPQMNLAISLHFADDKKRSEYMPVNRKYNLAELKKALQKYFQLTRRKVFIEYIMLEGINDGREDAENLAAYLKGVGDTELLHVHPSTFKNKTKFVSRFAKSAGINSRAYTHGVKGVGVNLIRYNSTDTNLKPSSKNKTQNFKDYLLQNKINATIRKSLGEEIQGACGQLAPH